MIKIEVHRTLIDYDGHVVMAIDDEKPQMEGIGYCRILGFNSKLLADTFKDILEAELLGHNGNIQKAITDASLKMAGHI